MSYGIVLSFIGVLGINQLVLQRFVAVRCDCVPCCCGILKRSGWIEILGTAACSSSEVRLCPFLVWGVVVICLE